MNAGVSTSPCGVVMTPARAAPSVWVTRNENIGARGSGSGARGVGPGRYYPCVKKLRVGVLYGGRSGEHEVSVASAASIFKHLDRTRYEAVPIRIEKDGRWVLADRPPLALSAAEVIGQARQKAARLPRAGRDTLVVSHPGEDT